jgi:eukaryotic-like serine/threonine-protein kinase
MIGHKKDHYELIRSLGKGGMGEVFLAYDSLCERQVALKMIREQLLKFPSSTARFLREAKIAAQLSHPCIIPIYSISQDPKNIYYTMSYVEGETLKQILKNAREREKKGEPLDPMGSIPNLARIFLSVCQAIAYTHSKGILHRDLKPENIIVGTFGEVLILDWGLADFIDKPMDLSELPAAEETPSDLTHPGTIVGTLTYLAPERVLGEDASIQTDIYSLGGILYTLLTLHLPFHRTTLKEFKKWATKEELVDPQEMAPYRDIPKQLSDIAKKCLAKDKTKRYSSVSELILDLEHYIEGKPDWLLAASLNIRMKKDWEFQENILFAKHVALTRETEIMEWVSLMISREGFSGHTCLETELRLLAHSEGIGFLLSVPKASERKGLEEGYCLWIGSEREKGVTLFRSHVEVVHIDDLFLLNDVKYKIRIEKTDTHLRFSLDGTVKIDYATQIPMTGTHVGVLYRDDLFEIGPINIFLGAQNVMVNCLAVPDAFLASKNFSTALSEYRRIAHCFERRIEGREALFRAGISLLQQALATSFLEEKQELLNASLNEFSKLHTTPSAPLEYLGKSLVYQAEGDSEEEAKCLELALRKYPKHPLSSLLVEQITFRLHEASYKDRLATYHLALLSERFLPHLFSNPDHRRLIESLQRHLEPLPFIEDPPSSITLELAFFLAKPQTIIDLIERNRSNSLFVANGLYALLVLKQNSFVETHFSLLDHDPLRKKQIEIALMPVQHALESFFTLSTFTLSFIELRTLIYLLERAFDEGIAFFTLPFFEKLDGFSLSDAMRVDCDVRHLWALLYEGQIMQAGNLIKRYPLEWLQNEKSPFYSLFGCYLWMTEGEAIAMAYFEGTLSIPFPPTSLLLAHYLMGTIDLDGPWMSQAFFWEKLQLFRQLILFYRCTHNPTQAELTTKKLHSLKSSL